MILHVRTTVIELANTMNSIASMMNEIFVMTLAPSSPIW